MSILPLLQPDTSIAEVCYEVREHIAFVQEVHVVRESRRCLLNDVVEYLQIVSRIQQVGIRSDHSVNHDRKEELELQYTILKFLVLRVEVCFVADLLRRLERHLS